MKTFKRTALRHTGLIILLATSAISSTAADEVPSHYAVTVVEDAAQGDTLLAGDVDQAIEQLTAQSGRQFATYNNLCVAHILANNLSAAKEACDAAVAVGKRRILGKDDWERTMAQRHYAHALANRGVAFALDGQTQAALRDFQLATTKGRGLSEPAANLRKLQLALRAVVAKR